jgi:hemerythrin
LPEQEKALVQLRKAVDNGFADEERLMRSKDFMPLHDEKDFHEIWSLIKNMKIIKCRKVL